MLGAMSSIKGLLNAYGFIVMVELFPQSYSTVQVQAWSRERVGFDQDWAFPVEYDRGKYGLGS